MDWLTHPWPWYVSGPLIGLTVPLMLLIGSKPFGISSNLRHLCAIVLPKKLRTGFFHYDWRSESWNLAFALGLLLGGVLAGIVFANPNPTELSSAAILSLQALGVKTEPGLLPSILANVVALNFKTWALLIVGGFLVGFGTRYGSGCTSGHAITGLATLQTKSLIATVSFFAGGILAANFLLPLFLR